MTSKPPFAKKHGVSPYAGYAETCAAYYRPPVQQPKEGSLKVTSMWINDPNPDEAPLLTCRARVVGDSYSEWRNGMLFHHVTHYDSEGNKTFHSVERIY